MLSVSLLPVYTKNKEEYMTRDEFEESRNNFNERAEETLTRQEMRNEKYNANLEAGKVSGFDKFIHGVNSVLAACIKSGTKILNDR